MPKVLRIEEILKKNKGIDPEKLREFLEFDQQLLNIPFFPEFVSPPSTRERLIVGDPDNDDSRTVRLRFSR